MLSAVSLKGSGGSWPPGVAGAPNLGTSTSFGCRLLPVAPESRGAGTALSPYPNPEKFGVISVEAGGWKETPRRMRANPSG